MYDIPCHTWNVSFFELMANNFGKYVCFKEGTSNLINMDIARILIRTSCNKDLNTFMRVKIDESKYTVRVVEDFYDPLRIELEKKRGSLTSSCGSSDSGFNDDDFKSDVDRDLDLDSEKSGS